MNQMFVGRPYQAAAGRASARRFYGEDRLDSPTTSALERIRMLLRPKLARKSADGPLAAARRTASRLVTARASAQAMSAIHRAETTAVRKALSTVRAASRSATTRRRRTTRKRTTTAATAAKRTKRTSRSRSRPRSRSARY